MAKKQALLKLKNNILVVNNSYIELVPIGDIHWGAWGCNEALFRKQIAYIEANENCVAIGVGDWLDMVTYHSKGLVGKQKKDADNQYFGILKMLQPIKHKILFALSGNHEARTAKCGAPDVMAQICHDLGVEYRGLDSYFAFKFPKTMVYCYAGHGSGGGATAGAKINRLINMHWQYPNADIIISGHTHSMTSEIKPLPFLTPYGKVASKLQYLICCGSMLESTEGYAKANFYAPQVTCFKVLKISIKRAVDGIEKVRLVESVVMGEQ